MGSKKSHWQAVLLRLADCPHNLHHRYDHCRHQRLRTVVLHRPNERGTWHLPDAVLGHCSIPPGPAPSASLPGIAGGQEARPAAAGHHWQHNRRPGAYVHLPGAGAVAILPHVRRDIRAGYVQHGRSAGRTRRHLQVVHQEARQGHGHWDYGHIDRRLHHRSNGRVVCGRVWMAHGVGLTRHIHDTGHHAHGRSVHAAPAGGHRPLAGRGRARWGRDRQGWLHRVPLDSSRGVQDQSALDNDGRSVPGQHGPHARNLSPGGLHPGQELQPGNRYGGGCDTCLLRHSRKADLGIHCEFGDSLRSIYT